MKKIVIFIGIILGVLFTIGLSLCLSSLVIWGIGNLIISLFSLTVAWTFLQSFKVAMLIWAIGFLLRNFMSYVFPKNNKKGE